MGNADIAPAVIQRLVDLRNDEKARHLSRFFKTAPGQYGEGDRFLGIPVPGTRAVVKDFRRLATQADVAVMVESSWHEVRLAGLLLLVEIYRRSLKNRRPDEPSPHDVVDFYLSVIPRGNNWDLVDLVAPRLLGDYLVRHPEETGVLRDLSLMEGRLWHQRVAIVANWTLIRHGIFAPVLEISERYLTHTHDLIHKATGWMLRETGKHGAQTQLREFLDRHAWEMPRTMLRYSLEKFPEDDRRRYMSLREPVAAP